MNLDALIAAALRRICKRVDTRARIALGERATTVRRSEGQKYRQRKQEKA